MYRIFDLVVDKWIVINLQIVLIAGRTLSLSLSLSLSLLEYYNICPLSLPQYRSPITQGPMMSIPGRKLNFHSKCLLCVVCRSPLTMGYGHTTVFLRHSLPHCASCYSTDNGK